jgi:hypothetical protein
MIKDGFSSLIISLLDHACVGDPLIFAHQRVFLDDNPTNYPSFERIIGLFLRSYSDPHHEEIFYKLTPSLAFCPFR